MNYHNILHDDMRNGTGLRVTLFLSGCSHHCRECQNPQTWDPYSGIEFDLSAKEEIFEQLNKDYINGITFSGGDPLYSGNIEDVLKLCLEIKKNYPNKTIWLYTGYEWEHIFDARWHYHPLTVEKLSTWRGRRQEVVKLCDVLVDGRYIDSLRDIKAHWVGSSNQRVIDVQESLRKGEIVLWATN